MTPLPPRAQSSSALVNRVGLRPVLFILPMLVLGLLRAREAEAHHLLSLLHQQPSALGGLLSGLAHPVLGPDHLFFLLALSLVGLRHRTGWMLGLLCTGLGGSLLGVLLPGLPGAEALVSFSLVIVALVLLGRLDRRLLLPAFALHGYVLSASVLGWTPAPLGFYLLGLLISQASLLLLALLGLRRLVLTLSAAMVRSLAAGLLGCGAAWTWSALVG
ncbi:MAG: HupE/UreJ family protein [Cyanobium sp.]